jgi:CubicO group peptidase (beta-lactamase class C family)
MTFLNRISLFFISVSELLIILFCLFISGCNSQQKNAKIIKKYSETIKVQWDSVLSPGIDNWFKKLNADSRFNGNLLVGKDGKVIYKNFCGYSNFDLKDTLSLNHRFQIASVSKTFTSMAILILKERGLINYTDEVSKYIPGFPYQGVTIKQLLSHRSGLPNYNYFCDEYTDKETIIYNNDVVRLMIDSIPAVYYQPNTNFNYCNTNYVILASIVERISQVPFEDFLRKEIFLKAGMKNTKQMINGRQNRLFMAATGYHFRWQKAELTYQDGVVGDKGVYTTIEDLWRWNLALENNILVRKETLAEAFEPAQIGEMSNKNYGLGWRLKTSLDGSKFVFHTGWWRGFNSLFLKDIKNDAVYIILSNVKTRAFYTMIQELLGIIDPVRRQMQIESDSLYLNKLNGQKDTVNLDMEF